MTINERIRKVLSDRKISQIQIGSALNIDRSSISKIINGKLGIPTELLIYLHTKWKIDLNWLLCGKYSNSNELITLKEDEIDYKSDNIKLIELYEENRHLLKENIQLKNEIQKLKENQKN